MQPRGDNMSELETIIRDYEEKLFQFFKRKIDAKVIECKANNYDPIKTYIEIRKLINELEEDVKMYTGLNQMNDELDTRVIMYTDEYMEEAIADFERRAKQLLETGNLSVTQVAEKCGFSGVYHFCRSFKNITGLTPTQFAKQSQKIGL